MDERISWGHDEERCHRPRRQKSSGVSEPEVCDVFGAVVQCSQSKGVQDVHEFRHNTKNVGSG